MSVAHRHTEEDCPHLEEGILRRWRGLGRWRALPARDHKHTDDRTRSCIQVSTSSMKHLCILLGCALLATLSYAQDTSAQDASSQEPTATFKSNVKLVSVFTTVVNKRGAPVAGLTKEDFAV